MSNFAVVDNQGKINGRQFFWFCLPALILGLILRIWLMVQVPYAFYHDDTPDFLDTASKLFQKGELEIHKKKTFLTPLLYVIPFAVKWPPVLVTVAVAQHLLGMITIVMIGLLCRLWFRHWKWFIIPLTLLMALNPIMLWYEHVLMAETHYVACVLLLAIAGTFYVRCASWRNFIFLCIALFLTAGARPEGKLFFAFGLFLVVLVQWKNWKPFRFHILILLAVGLLTSLVTKTGQSGLLLYTSVVHLSPDHLKSAPGSEPFIHPLRDKIREDWKKYPAFAKVRARRDLSAVMDEYFTAHPEIGKKGSKDDINEVCKKMAIETCIRRFYELPKLFYYKFRETAIESPGGSFDERWFHEKQIDAMEGKIDVVKKLSPRLAGVPLTHETEVEAFIKEKFNPEKVKVLQRWYGTWENAVNAVRLSSREYPEANKSLPGLPLFFIVAVFGMIAACLRRDEMVKFQIPWVMMLLGLLFIIILTANVKARFRFVFEPFWWIYLLMLLDSAIYLISSLWRRKRTISVE